MDNKKWNHKYAASERLWPEEPSAVLVDEVSGLSPGRALDIAAGEGRNAIWMAKAGWQVHALDFSDVAVARGRAFSKKAGLDIEWEVQDITTFCPAEDAYDLVYIFYLHLPWEEMSGVIRRAGQALKRMGRLLIVGHDRSNIGRGTGGPQDSEVVYTSGEILKILDFLEIERAGTICRPVEHEHSRDQSRPSEMAVDCIVLARRTE